MNEISYHHLGCFYLDTVHRNSFGIWPSFKLSPFFAGSALWNIVYQPRIGSSMMLVFTNFALWEQQCCLVSFLLCTNLEKMGKSHLLLVQVILLCPRQANAPHQPDHDPWPIQKRNITEIVHWITLHNSFEWKNTLFCIGETKTWLNCVTFKNKYDYLPTQKEVAQETFQIFVQILQVSNEAGLSL